MKHLVYEKYVDCGIDWLGEIPEHWKFQKLKYISEITMGQSPDSNDYIEDIEALPFLQGNADFNNLYPTARIYCNTANKIAHKNEILLSVRAPIGALNIADRKYGIGRGLCAINSRNIDRKYLYYQLLIKNSELNSIGTGSTFTAISIDEIRNLSFIIPAITEQRSIAAFLDRETARIDALIDKKQKLIALLKEKRTALITRAVTKGLNPDVKMKDSGIEWLGEIPEHWEVKRLKHLAEINPSKSRINPALIQQDAEVSFLPMEKVGEDGSVNLDTKKSITQVLSSFTYFENGDVIVAKITPCFENGKGAYLEKLLNNVGFGSTEFHVFRTKPDYQRWLYYLTVSDVFRKRGEANMVGAAGQKRVSLGFIKHFEIGIPPKTEALLISSYLDNKIHQIENLNSKIESSIQKYHEYRTALISAAVTGKVRVG